MSFFGDASREWLDVELRRVPLPPGLLARLRNIAVADDDQLDAALRHVPLPAGLLLRLRGIATYEDEFVDAELKDVPVPERLLAQLRLIPEYPPTYVDADLRDVPLPAGLLDRLQAIASSDQPVTLPERSYKRRGSWWQLTAAAALLFMISFSYLTAIAAFVSTAYQAPAEQVFVVMVADEPIRLELGSSDAVDVADFETETTTLVAGLPQPDVPSGKFDWRDLQQDAVVGSELLASGPYGETLRWLDDATADAMLLGDVMMLKYRPFAARPTDQVPPLATVADIRPRGIVPNWVSPEQYLFHMRYAAHPFLDPSSHADLLSTLVPLGATTASYLWAGDIIRDADATAADRKDSDRKDSDRKDSDRKDLEGLLARRVRTEDFLQAVDFPVSPPDEQSLGLRVYGGPSPFGGPATQLLQVVVRARDAATAGEVGTHLTVLVDTSRSPDRPVHLRRTRRALYQLVDRLGPLDRLSLAACSDTPRPLIQNAGRSDAAALRSAIDMLVASPGTNVGEAVRFGASLIREGGLDESATASSLLLVSGTVGLIPEWEAAQIENILVELANLRVRIGIVDLAGNQQTDPLLARLASATGGSVAAGGDVEDIIRALDEARTGQSQLVASGARLTVRFNPQAVTQYRMLGHDATSTLGIVAAPVECDLHAGQRSGGLFEIRLDPRGSNDVGTAELTWRDPTSGRQHRLRQPVSRIQFAPTFAQSALPLQAASLAAETAEILRRSPYVARPASSLSAVRQLADQVDPQLRDARTFREFVDFLDTAQRVGLR